MISFTHPLFLAALAALAIPIILHLMHRQMPRRLVFPTIRFILKGQEARQGKRGLREILTLLARLAILTLLILLFAEPFIRGARRRLTATANAEIVLFYDLSASMNAHGKIAEFIRAETGKLFNQHPQARYALVASSNKVKTTLPLGTAPRLIRQKLESLRPTVFRGDHEAALNEAAGLFSAGKDIVRTVYIFSDLQRQDWAAANLRGLKNIARIRFVRPPGKTPDNLAILDVFHESFAHGKTRRLRATVQVRNYGLTARKARLTLRAGDRSITRKVNVRGEHRDKFVLDLESPESSLAVAELETGDAYTLDDRYHFWIGPRTPVKTVIIAAQNATKQLEAFFLSKALTASQPGFETFEVGVFLPGFILEKSPRPYQGIFVLDAIKDYSEIELETLKEWVVKGGVLVYFSGRYSADSLENLRRIKLGSTRFLGFQGELNQLRAFSLRSLASGAAVAAPFEKEPSDLFLFPVYRYCRLKPGLGARRLLTFEGGDPFLVQEDVGKGSVFVFAVSLSPSWSDFPTSMSFLPLVRRIIEVRAGARDHGIIKLELGENIAAKLAEYGVTPAKPLPNSPGVTLVRNLPVELNVTRAESDLRPLDEFELASRLGAESEPGQTGAATLRTAGKPAMFNRHLAWALLTLIFIELLLANMMRVRRR